MSLKKWADNGFTENFKREVITWLAAHYPELASNF